MPVKVAMGRESLLWEGKPDERSLHAREEGVLCMLRKIALREATTQAMACPLPTEVTKDTRHPQRATSMCGKLLEICFRIRAQSDSVFRTDSPQSCQGVKTLAAQCRETLFADR